MIIVPIHGWTTRLLLGRCIILHAFRSVHPSSNPVRAYVHLIVIFLSALDGRCSLRSLESSPGLGRLPRWLLKDDCCTGVDDPRSTRSRTSLRLIHADISASVRCFLQYISAVDSFNSFMTFLGRPLIKLIFDSLSFVIRHLFLQSHATILVVIAGRGSSLGTDASWASGRVPVLLEVSLRDPRTSGNISSPCSLDRAGVWVVPSIEVPRCNHRGWRTNTFVNVIVEAHLDLIHQVRIVSLVVRHLHHMGARVHTVSVADEIGVVTIIHTEEYPNILPVSVLAGDRMLEMHLLGESNNQMPASMLSHHLESSPTAFLDSESVDDVRRPSDQPSTHSTLVGDHLLHPVFQVVPHRAILIPPVPYRALHMSIGFGLAHRTFDECGLRSPFHGYRNLERQYRWLIVTLQRNFGASISSRLEPGRQPLCTCA